MKNTLPTIVQKFSDVRVVQSELEAMMQGPRREAITMMFLVIANVPLLYFLNKDWFHTQCHFRDEDNDGVCNFAYTSCTFVDADEDGICDNCGINIDEMGYGRHYIDADNDGICDNYTEGVCPQNGAGRGYGCRRGHNR